MNSYFSSCMALSASKMWASRLWIHWFVESFQKLARVWLHTCYSFLFSVATRFFGYRRVCPFLFSVAVRLFSCIQSLWASALDRFGSDQALFPECLCFAPRSPRMPLSG